MKSKLFCLLFLSVASSVSAHSFHQYVVSTATVTDSANGTPTAITGLAIPVLASQSYMIHCYIKAKSNLATTGTRYSVTGPASPAGILMLVKTVGASAGTQLVENSITTDYSFVSASTTSTTDYHIDEITMTFANGVTAGTLQLFVDAETSDTVSVAVGSWCEVNTPRPGKVYTPLG